jgi:hypothetical protein
VPKHHKTIVGINPIGFGKLKESLAAALPAFQAEGEPDEPEITQFLVDTKRDLAVVTFKTHGSRTFEEVAGLIRGEGYEPYEIGPINLDDAPGEPASAE